MFQYEFQVIACAIAASIIRGAGVAVIAFVIVIGVDAPKDRITKIVCAIVSIVADQYRYTASTLRLLASTVFGTCVTIIARSAVE